MTNNPFSLEGKNAWITGASYGIGFNIAKAFVAAGIKNIIFNDINEAALERGLNNYKEAGIENVKGYVCDVTKEDDVKALVEQIHKEVGQRKRKQRTERRRQDVATLRGNTQQGKYVACIQKGKSKQRRKRYRRDNRRRN